MSLGHHAERAQLDLFRALPGDLAPRDAQDLIDDGETAALAHFAQDRAQLLRFDGRAGGIGRRSQQQYRDLGRAQCCWAMGGIGYVFLSHSRSQWVDSVG